VIEVEKPAESRATGDLATCPVLIRRATIPDELIAYALLKTIAEPRPIQPPTMGKVVALPEVGGLHHRYERLAA
jgi:hypothetical protein